MNKTEQSEEQDSREIEAIINCKLIGKPLTYYNDI